MREEFAALQSLDGVRASGSLERLEQNLAPSLVVPLASLLAQSPDPQGALRQLDRYVEAGSAEMLEDLTRHPAALIYLVAIFGYSEFLAEAILTDPSLVIQFARDRHLTKLKSIQDLMQDYARYSVTSPDLWLSSQLARFKRRNLVRIALKDVLGLSTLGETTLELATLADVILNHSLAYCDRELEKRHGLPQYRDRQGRIARSGFSILSLGKLGGNELNYSPDIDLIFLYARDGETSGGSEPASVISNKEYFARLSEAVNRTITQSTPHGEVYRVDLSKRPEGEEGGFTISVSSALEYYDRRARDWELQMLIKARHSAGDVKLSREFLHGVEPFVYRPTGTAKSAVSRPDEREKSQEAGGDSANPGLDVNFHPGGLRDIETLTQSLQRIHGANDFWVRSGGTLLALRKLHDKGRLTDTDFARLTSAYEFLREVEHRIQLEAGPHPHRLPAAGRALDRLARCVNNDLASAGDAGEVLVTKLKQTFFTVQEISHRLIQVGDTAGTSADFGLSAAGNWPPDSAHDPFRAAVRLLASRAWELAAIAQEVPLEARARCDAARLITAIVSSSECLRTVRQIPTLLRRALDITAVSTFLAQTMIQHPEDLAVLGSQYSEDLFRSPAQMNIRLQENSLTGGGSPADAPGLYSEDAQYVEPFAWATENGLSLTEKMAMLRAEYRAQTLALGAGDCARFGSINFSLFRWNKLAVRCVRSAVEIAERSGSRNRDFKGSRFVVLGLSSLGRSGFDLGSTAELVFVVPELPKEEQNGPCSRLAKSIVEILSSYTCEGDVFPTELQLQFQGSPVVTEDALLRYFAGGANFDHVLRFAHAWPVAGNLEFGRELLDRLRAVLFKQIDSRSNLAEDLRSQFSKFVSGDRAPNSRPQQPSREFNAVGLALGALRWRHHISLPAGTNIPEQITALHAARLISSVDADSLTRDVIFLASADHAFRLVTGAAAGEPPEIAGPSEEVENLVRRWGLINANESLAALLAAASHRLNAVCLRLAGLSPEAGTNGVSR